MSAAVQQILLADAATYERCDRVLNEHYNRNEYRKRRMTHLANADRKSGIEPLNHSKTAEDEADQVFEGQTPGLSVQQVRRRELELQISPLTPLPTPRNTDSINNYADYPSTEWQYGDPDDFWEIRRTLFHANEDDDAGDTNSERLSSGTNIASAAKRLLGKRRRSAHDDDDDDDNAPPSTPTRAQSADTSSRPNKTRKLITPAVALAARGTSLPVKLGSEDRSPTPSPTSQRRDSIFPSSINDVLTQPPAPQKTKGRAGKKANTLAAIATGDRLPRSRVAAAEAAALRKDDLLSARRQRRSRSAAAPTPDLMPEFWETGNYTAAEGEEGAVRCSCGAVVDGTQPFIACEAEGCDSWQHIACMGEAVPRVDGAVDTEARYECYQCDPWAHRKMLQTLRKGRRL